MPIYLGKNSIDSVGIGDAKSSVSYAAQTLTEDQKIQARTNIGAADAEEVSRLSEAIADKLPKNFGAANAGKILVVGSDGNLTLTDMPEGGVSGDVVGTLDESNNILLSGNLADGTYTLKYANADGTYTEIGMLEVGAIPEPEPAYINQIPISVNTDGTLFVGSNGEKGYKTGYRLSLSSGNESAQEGTEVTGYIPVTPTSVIRIKNIAYSGDTARGVVGYDANFKIISIDGNTSSINLNGMFVDYGYDDGNGVRRSGKLNGYPRLNTSSIKYIRLCSTDINENSILTVDQEIV